MSLINKLKILMSYVDSIHDFKDLSIKNILYDFHKNYFNSVLIKEIPTKYTFIHKILNNK